jgi:hypothetical protein
MAKFVIHKKGFFYTDEAFEAAEGVKGSIVGTFNQIEEAKKEKELQDIYSMQKLEGMNAVDFFFYAPNYDEIYKKIADYYQSEFGLTIEDEDYFDFPKKISTEQAKMFLGLLNVSFHDIIEYADDEELDPDSFNLEEDGDLGEF